MNTAAEKIIHDDDDERFLIQSRTEIVFLLRNITKQKSLITVYFNGGSEFMLTSIVGVNESNNTVLLDIGPDEDLNRRLFDSRKLWFTTTHDRVKVKFSGGQPQRATHDGHAAFSIGIPHPLTRMQRREYYRITTGIINPLKCRILIAADGVETMAEVTVLDLSCGGVALIDQHHSVDLEPNNSYEKCHLRLPDAGIIVTGLRVCNTFEVTLRNGLVCKRSGCEFIGMNEGDRGRVQRYITKQERELYAKNGK